MLIGLLVFIAIVASVVMYRYGWRPTIPNIRAGEGWWRVVNPWIAVIVGLVMSHIVVGVSWPEAYKFLVSLRVFWVGHLILLFISATANQRGAGVVGIRRLVLWIWVICALAEVGGQALTIVATSSQASAAAKPLFTDITFTVTAEKEWSVPVTVPVGANITWASEKSLVKYEAISQEGLVHAYPAPEDVYVPFPGRLSSVRFRTAEAEPVAIRVSITQ